jgi:hypothetical protein
MNPLLFADWRHINRLFTRVMWGAATVLAFVVLVLLTTPGPGPAPSGRATVARPGLHAQPAGLRAGRPS